MEIQELFAGLEQRKGSFPTELIDEAIARREEITPALLEILADIDRNPEPWLADQDRMVHIYAMYLLAQFRETRAYPLLVKIFSRPGRFAFDLAGHVTTQDLSRILCSVSGGDTAGMKELIENENANEYVRASAMDAMGYLVKTGQQTREEVMQYFLQLFDKFERKPGYEWSGLTAACCDLWPQEAMDKIRQAYEEGLVDPRCVAWEDVQKDLARGKEHAMRFWLRDPLITDVAKSMRWMSCFDKDQEQMRHQLPTTKSPPQNGHSGGTFYRSTPKTGRNDPCHCGSGKKFKKCCGTN